MSVAPLDSTLISKGEELMDAEETTSRGWIHTTNQAKNHTSINPVIRKP